MNVNGKKKKSKIIKLMEVSMDKLSKKLKKLEKEFDRNPNAALKNSKILKRAAKLQAKIDK